MELGTKEQPIAVRVASVERADRVFSICREHDIEVLVAIEHDQPEDLGELRLIAAERLHEARAAAYQPRLVSDR